VAAAVVGGILINADPGRVAEEAELAVAGIPETT
jgi:hypothetical protein